MEAVEYFPFTPCPLLLHRAKAGDSLAVDQVIAEFESGSKDEDTSNIAADSASWLRERRKQ